MSLATSHRRNYDRGTNCHRAETVAVKVCSPLSIGVALASTIRDIMIGCGGRIGVSDVESSRSDPKVPPAAFARASASARALATAAPSATRRTESAFEE